MTDPEKGSSGGDDGGAQGDETMQAGAAGDFVRSVAIAAVVGCGTDGRPVTDGGSRDGGAPADARGVKPGKVRRARGLAHAAERERAVEAERSRVVLILEKPEDWDGTVRAFDPVRPEADLRHEPIQQTRDGVVLALSLPCQPFERLTEVRVHMGRSDEGGPDEWKLRISTPGLMHTYGTDRPIGASSLIQNFGEPAAPDLPSGTPVNFTFRHWVAEGLRFTAGGKVTNPAQKPQQVQVTTDYPYALVSHGQVVLPNGFVVGPGESFQVLAYTEGEDSTCPSEPAMIDVQLTDVE